MTASLVLLVGGCGDGGSATGDVGDDPEVGLVGTEWRLVETVVGGEATEVPDDVDAVVRFDGEGGWSAQGCNHLGGGVEIEGTRLTFDGETVTTDMACAELVMAVDAAITTVFDGTVDAALNGDDLTLGGLDGDELHLRVRDGIYPSRTMIPLDQGTRDGGDYRFGYEDGEDGAGPYASWEGRSAPGEPWGYAGSGPPSDPHRPDPLGGGFGEETEFVLGVIGADVARIAYEPPAGEPTELTQYDLGVDHPEWQAYGGFVEEPAVGSYVVAYDAAGVELGRSVDLRWPMPEPG